MASEYIISTFGNEYLQSIPRVVKNRGNAQEAHEAIRPTRMNKEISMTPEHQKLYSLIWKRALGFLMSPAEFYDTELQIRDSSFNESMYFKTVISTCLFTGFLILDDKTSVSKKEAKKKLDLWQTVDCEKIIGFEKYQNPPNHFDESTLVKEMEQAGVGRPATYQASIDKLIDKKYIEKKKFSRVFYQYYKINLEK
jgi:DNA topoisomerase-1